jgi:hypothetical protein
MAIVSASLKFYRSTVVSDAAGNGAGIDTGALIPDATSQNILPNVSDADRITGITQYRKIFLRNENVDAYNNVHAWISANTPDADTEVSIVAGGSVSTQGTDTIIPTTTFTFAASATVIASVDCSKQIRPGEMIWNSTDDTNSAKVVISDISADGLTITLGSSYGGTTGAGKAATVQKITDSTFVLAINEGAGVSLGNLAQNQSVAIWVKRVVAPNSSGYTDDTFTIAVSNS